MPQRLPVTSFSGTQYFSDAKCAVVFGGTVFGNTSEPLEYWRGHWPLPPTGEIEKNGGHDTRNTYKIAPNDSPNGAVEAIQAQNHSK